LFREISSDSEESPERFGRELPYLQVYRGRWVAVDFPRDAAALVDRFVAWVALPSIARPAE
jgi:hypothetical protein